MSIWYMYYDLGYVQGNLITQPIANLTYNKIDPYKLGPWIHFLVS